MSPIDLGTEAAPGRKLYWRPASVASHIGLSPRAFVADCEAGRIPVRVEFFTERRHPMVHSGDVLAYLASIGKGLAP
jgi:hypothetical protein